MKAANRTGVVAFSVVFGGAALLVGVVAVFAGGSTSRTDWTSRAEQVTAEELARTHEQNPAASAKRWDGLRVEVSGTVDNISRKEGRYWLFFQVTTTTKGPAVEFSGPDALARVKRGDKLRVKGRVKILDSGQLTITDPTLVH